MHAPCRRAYVSSEPAWYFVTRIGGALLVSSGLGVALTWAIGSVLRRDLRAMWAVLGVGFVALGALLWASAWTIFLVAALVLGLGVGCLAQAVRPRSPGPATTV